MGISKSTIGARLDGAMVKALAFGPENPSLNLQRNPCLQGDFFGAIHLEKNWMEHHLCDFFINRWYCVSRLAHPPMH